MQTNDDDQIIVLCGPASVVHPGSKLFKCTECGQDCSSSPIGQKLIAQKGALPYCPTCGVRKIKKDIDAGQAPEFMDPTEAILHAVDRLRGQENN